MTKKGKRYVAAHLKSRRILAMSNHANLLLHGPSGPSFLAHSRLLTWSLMKHSLQTRSMLTSWSNLLEIVSP